MILNRSSLLFAGYVLAACMPFLASPACGDSCQIAFNGQLSDNQTLLPAHAAARVGVPAVASERAIFSADQIARFAKNIKAGNSIYEDEILYLVLEQNIEFAKDVVRQYDIGTGLVTKVLGQTAKQLGDRYCVLYVDPGILSRGVEFIDFAAIFLAKNPNISPYLLRQAFADYLTQTQGNASLYRGMMITGRMAERMRQVGIPAPGLRDSSNFLNSIQTALSPSLFSHNPFSEINARQQTIDNLRDPGSNTSLSLSAYREVSESVGYHASGIVDKPGERKLYLFKVEVPRIATIELHTDNLLMNVGWGRGVDNPASLVIGDLHFQPDRDPGVEVFMMYGVPAKYIRSVEKVETPINYSPHDSRTEDLVSDAQHLKSGNYQDRLRYVEGHFTEDVHFESTVKSWLIDPATPFQMKYKIMTFFLNSCRNGKNIDIFRIQEVRTIYQSIASADKEALKQRWAWLASDKQKDMIRSVAGDSSLFR